MYWLHTIPDIVSVKGMDLHDSEKVFENFQYWLGDMSHVSSLDSVNSFRVFQSIQIISLLSTHTRTNFVITNFDDWFQNTGWIRFENEICQKFN